jgi:hypothetical protein
MNKLFLVCAFISLMVSCQKNETEAVSSKTDGKAISTEATNIDTNAAVIKFEESIYDFGKVTDGDTVKHIFKFTNVGKKYLKIANAAASCGCTIPSWPKDSIKPGDSGEINVVFNSKNRVGAVDKTVTVTANTQPNETQVKLIGKVEEK